MAICYQCRREIPPGGGERREVLTGKEIYRGRRTSTRTTYGLRTLCDDCANQQKIGGNGCVGLLIAVVVGFIILRSCSLQTPPTSNAPGVSTSSTNSVGETSEQARLRAEQGLPRIINQNRRRSKGLCTSVSLREDKPFHYLGVVHFDNGKTWRLEVSMANGKGEWRTY